MLTVRSQFETLEWTLQTEDGRIIDLLQGSGADPFQQTPVAGNTQGLAA